MHPITASLCVALFVSGPCFAADPPSDLDALTLADKAPEVAPQVTSPWRAFGELAAGRSDQRSSDQNSARLSLDLRFDDTIAPGLRAVFSDRLDLVHRSGEPGSKNLNTLREAYLSWSYMPDLLFDLGRVNLRHGAALGFNPSDWFKEGALRSTVSVDPMELRENRQGSFILRTQRLWSQASLSASLSPKLSSKPSDSTFALDTGSTNPRHRWLLSGSYKFSDRFAPEVLLHGGEGTPTQLGLNASTLVGESSVVFGEVSMGKGRSLTTQAFALADAEQTQRRAAFGLTYTTAFNLSITAEAEYNSAAPNQSQWRSLTAMAPGAGLAFLSTAQRLQDLPMRQAWFVHAAWKDAFVRRFDLAAYVRRDNETGSRAQWLEARYRWDSADLALQWIGHSGAPESIYGTVPLRRSVELALRVYH